MTKQSETCSVTVYLACDPLCLRVDALGGPLHAKVGTERSTDAGGSVRAAGGGVAVEQIGCAGLSDPWAERRRHDVHHRAIGHRAPPKRSRTSESKSIEITPSPPRATLATTCTHSAEVATVTDVPGRHRRLARSLVPLPEESLPGFLLRLAHRLGLSPGRIAGLCGLTSYERRPPAYHLIGLPDDIAAFAATARLSRTEVGKLTLRRYAATYPALAKAQMDSKISVVAQREYWALNASSRYCPECLRGDGSPAQSAHGGPWKLSWHLPVVFACPLHDRLLEVVCPECGNVLGGATRNRGSLVRRPLLDGLHPLQCRNPMPERPPAPGRVAHREACLARLDMAPQTSGSQLSAEGRARLITLQERMDRWLAPGSIDPAEPSVREQGGPFPDLILAAQLIKLSWPAGAELTPTPATSALIDAHAAPITAALDTPKPTTSKYLRVPELWSAPTDPAACGALLLAADTLLSTHESASLRERIQPLVS